MDEDVCDLCDFFCGFVGAGTRVKMCMCFLVDERERAGAREAIALRGVQWQGRATGSNHERDLEERSDSAYPTHDERCGVLESSICARMPALTLRLLAVNRRSQGLRLTIVSYATSKTSVQDVQMRRAVPICGSDGGERTRAGWDAWGAVV